MSWISMQHVVDDLGLKLESVETDQVLRSIREEMSIIHPDRNQGEFLDANVKQRWHKLSQAKEFVEAYQHAVIPVSYLPAIVSAMQARPMESLEQRSSRFIDETRLRIGDRVLVPKITSGLFAAISGFLVTVPSTLKDNEILGPVLRSSAGQMTLLAALFYSGAFFVITWMSEGTTKRKIELLMTNTGRHKLLADVVLRDKEVRRRFTFENFVAEVGYSRFRIDPLGLLMLGSSRLDRPTAEKTAKLMLEQLKEEKVVVELPRDGLSETYEISDRVASELQDFARNHYI